MQEIKKLYKSLLEDGDLSVVLPAAKGIWEEDKKDFTEFYHQNQQFINDIEVDDFEEFIE